MSRGLSSAVITELESAQTTVEHLIEIEYWDPSTSSVDYERITTAAFDINYNGNTFDAVGIPSGETALGLGAVNETQDLRAQSIEIKLDAVDQTFPSKLLNRDFRGRTIKIWKRFFDESDGTVISTFKIWQGLQNDDYEVSHNRQDENDSDPATATITTQSVSEVARLNQTKSIRTNVRSHQAMLDRAGLTPDDTGFSTVAAVVDRKIFWGTDEPQSIQEGDSTGATGGDDMSYVGPNQQGMG